MTRSFGRILAAALGAAVLSASCGESTTKKPTPDVDPQKILTHLERFRAVEASGVPPGSRAEQQAVAYSKSVFTEMGVSVQTPQVPLTNIKTTRVTVDLTGAGGARSLVDDEDIVAWTRRHDPVTTANGDLMFVGYGISSPRQGWDDYKGANVRGKILLMLIGDPHVGQRHLLGTVGGDLFGRSRYKFDEAERRGAAGVLLVHLADQAEDSWDQIQEGATEVLDAGRPGEFTSHLPIEGWISLAAARQMFTDSALDFDEALTNSEESNFAPINLPIRAVAHVESEITATTTSNVLATIPPVGTAQEYVLFSTQWNDLPAGRGTGRDLTDEDPLNQAAPGAPVLLEVARALSKVKTPHRGFVFLIVTAEPQGLLGLDGYLENPAFAHATTRAAIHVAGFNARGDDNHIAIIGFAYEALKGMVRDRAAEQFRVTEGDQDVERLHFFRPARVAYTLKEIPSMFISSGRTLDTIETTDPPPPNNMSVGAQDAQLLYHVGLQVAVSQNWPAWQPSRSLLDYAPSLAKQLEDRRARGIR